MIKSDVFIGRDGRYYIIEYWPDGGYDVIEVTGMKVAYSG